MKLPWVSRAALETCQAWLRDAISRGDLRVLAAESETAMWRARAESSAAQVLVHQEHASAIGKRYDDLLAKYHALKLAGAVVVEPVHTTGYAPVLPADPVRDAIRKQVRHNPGMAGLGGYLNDYARELRDQGVDESRIPDLLSKWESSEEQSRPVDSYVEPVEASA